MKILCFSPFSGIWEFAMLEGRVAAGLAAQGNEVVFVTCAGLLRRHCLVMAAHGVASTADERQRDEVCKDCTVHAQALKEELGLRGVTLAEMVGSDLRSEVERLMSELNLESALDLVIDGIPVGRRALYPFLALKKKDQLDFSDAEWREYLTELHNTILAVRGAQALIDRYKPDAVISYSSTYSVVAACLEVARLNGVKDYFIEASGGMGSRHYRGILARGGIAAWYQELRKLWEQVSGQPARPEHMRLVTDHMLHLFASRSVFVYSPSTQPGDFDVRAMVGARPDQKILLATMSSYDEWFAAEQAGLFPVHESAFTSQIEWIQTLFQVLTKRKDWFLVLRVHPREFPNRREGAYSAHSQRLLHIFKTMPDNCRVNWPDEQRSLYDLAKGVDVVLNAWSSAGKEMTLLGLPVVEWAPDVLLYPPDARYVARRASDYVMCIDHALADGWSADHVRRMYRWCALEYGTATFETAAPPSLDPSLMSFSRRVLRAIHRRISAIGADRSTLRRRPLTAEVARQLASAIKQGAPGLAHTPLLVDRTSAASLSAETQALCVEVERLVIGLFGSREGFSGSFKEALVSMTGTAGRYASNSERFEAKRVV